LNGSFYKRLDIPGSHTGMVWQNPEESSAIDNPAAACRSSGADSTE
jgi:hypothetical protein